MRKGTVAFANFVCTFGDAGGFLDQSNITLQAFLTDTLVRTYGNSHYHLYDAKLVTLDDLDGAPVLGIQGHFVKNTTLTREQIFDDDQGLIASRESMISSPSAFFVLVLNTHRLVYFAETNNAPDIKSFEATMGHFIKKVRERQIELEYKSENNQLPRTELQRRLPRPSVKVTPLSEEGLIVETLRAFAKVKTVRFRLIRPNHEPDASEVVGAVQGRFAALQPDRLDIIASRNDGLDIQEVETAVGETVQSGNTEVRISGEDKDGGKITASNNEFALVVHLDDPAKTDNRLSSQLYKLYSKLAAAGKIKVSLADAAVGAQIEKLMKLR